MFLDAISRKIEPDPDTFPWSVPVFRWLEQLRFRAPVTFLVGENGSGKSTLLEGLAAGMEAVVAGGADMERDETLAAARRFAAGYRFSRRNRPRAKLFVRAEDLFGFVRRVGRDMSDLSELEEHYRTTIKGDYGRQLAMGSARGQRSALAGKYGEDPDARSHGETFLNLLEQRLVVEGLYFLDEPEAPLSPLRQLTLISLLKQVVADGSQLVICTHSPILMAFPGAEILLFEGDQLTPTPWDELDHVRLTRAFLNDPESYLRRL
ncbi:MAG TPA: AAA family ATPase [Caulobacteraceae bacterium]|jgi:predicted ATPase|nr:AAA family ATPase [Caulobacteraceae bacterium]